MSPMLSADCVLQAVKVVADPQLYIRKKRGPRCNVSSLKHPKACLQCMCRLTCARNLYFHDVLIIGVNPCLL